MKNIIIGALSQIGTTNILYYKIKQIYLVKFCLQNKWQSLLMHLLAPNVIICDYRAFNLTTGLWLAESLREDLDISIGKLTSVQIFWLEQAFCWKVSLLYFLVLLWTQLACWRLMPLGCLLIGSVMPLWVLFSLFMNVPFNQKKKKKTPLVPLLHGCFWCFGGAKIAI